MNKKTLVFSLMFVLVFSLSFASAGFFGDLFAKITGKNIKQVPEDLSVSEKIPVICKEGPICLDENFKAYQNSDCSLGKGIYCENGCIAGECVEAIEQIEEAEEIMF
jgi:hypothetical protein